MSKIGHLEVAVLTKVNELAERYGIDLSAFDAEYDTETGALSFPSTPAGEQYQQFEKMSAALGCQDGTLSLDSDADLLKTLDEALHTAPRARRR